MMANVVSVRSAERRALRDVSVWVQTKDLGCVRGWQGLDVLHVLFQCLTHRDLITRVVAEGWFKHLIVEPHLSKQTER